MKINTVNPFTEDVITDYPVTSRLQIEDKINEARKTQDTWIETSHEERAKMLKKLARKLLAHKDKLATSITDEMGKPAKEAISEVEKCALLASYYAQFSRRWLKDEPIATKYVKSYVTYEPLGIVGAIMPWNFPMWQTFRCLIPAVAAGNAVLIKPSNITTKSGGIQITDIFLKTKFPENLVQTVIGDHVTGQSLVESRVNAISFTGSLEAGEKMAYIGAKGMKKVILELGGSDPFIVLEDADIDKAAKAAVAGRFINAGQSCIAAKRIIVVSKVAKEFTEKFVDYTKTLVVGDPNDEKTDMGPLVREIQRTRLEEQVNPAIAAGAKVLIAGGRPADGKGFFFKPIVLTNIKNDIPLCQEETFGPVAPILVAGSEAEAFNIANDTKYGLGASIWAKNERAPQLAKKIASGMVFINETVKSDPRLPFGGIKKSGLGRELSRIGLMEMVVPKTIVIN